MVMTLFISNTLYAKQYSGLYVFGDSISSDIIYNSMGPNSRGTGQNWPFYFKDLITGENAAYVNYAAGGMRTGTILESVIGHMASNPVDPNAMYSVWGGFNDIKHEDLNSVNNITGCVNELLSYGAKNIIVSNIYENPYLNSSLVLDFNSQLYANIRAMSTSSNIILGDINNLIKEFIASPATYGFGSSDEVLLDSLHLSENAREMVADYYYSVLESPATISLLPEAPLSTSRNNHKTIANYQQTYYGKKEAGVIYPLVGFSSSDSTTDETPTTSSLDASNTSVNCGACYLVNPYLLIGGLFNSNSSTLDFGHSWFSADCKHHIFSGFMGLEYKSFFVDVVLSKGIIDFDKVSRTVPLGSSFRKHTGDAGGDSLGLELALRYDLVNLIKEKFSSASALSFGPLVSMSQHRISVDSINEKDSLSSSMFYDAQDRDSNVMSYGAFIAYETQAEIGRFKIFGTYTSSQDSEDDQRNVTAGLTSYPSITFETEGFKPESKFSTASLGIDFEPKSYALISLSYNRHDGDLTSESMILLSAHLKLKDFSKGEKIS